MTVPTENTCTASCLEAFPLSGSAHLFASTAKPFIAPLLGVGSPQRLPCLFLYFVLHTTNVTWQKKLSALNVLHFIDVDWIVHIVQSKTPGHTFSRRLHAWMVFTTTNWMLKDTALEIKNGSPVFKLRLFSLHLCLQLFGADSMIEAWTHRRKACCCRICSCNWWACLVLQIRCFHKRFCNTRLCRSSSRDPEPFNYSPGHLNMKTTMKTTPHSPNHDPVGLLKLLPNESGHSHSVSFCYCRKRLVHHHQHRSLIWIQVIHSFLDQIYLKMLHDMFIDMFF